MDILWSRVVVCKDGGRYIAFLSEYSFQLCNDLINTNTLTHLHCHKHFGGGLSSFPGYLGHSTKEASRACRRLDLGQTLRDLAVKRELLEQRAGDQGGNASA